MIMLQLVEHGPHRRFAAFFRCDLDLLFHRFRRRGGPCHFLWNWFLRSGFLRLNVILYFSHRLFRLSGRFRGRNVDMRFVDRQIVPFKTGRPTGVEIQPLIVQCRNGNHPQVGWTVDAGEPRMRLMPSRRHDFDDFPCRLMLVDFAEQVADSDRLESYESAHHKWLAVALPQLACTFPPRSTQSTQKRRTHT